MSYPAYACVSPVVLDRLVETAYRRASDYGFRLRQTIGQFVALMAAVAPNFDLHPAVHAILVNPAFPLEGRVEALTQRLPDKVWDEVMARASNIGWFLDRDAFDMASAARIAVALGKAMNRVGASVDRQASVDSLSQAIAAAAKHQWHSEDAQFVFVAAWLTYGAGFDVGGDKLPWLADVFDPESAVKTQVVLMRMRLALDRQLWL